MSSLSDSALAGPDLDLDSSLPVLVPPLVPKLIPNLLASAWRTLELLLVLVEEVLELLWIEKFLLSDRVMESPLELTMVVSH